jgi:hypothetical protein
MTLKATGVEVLTEPVTVVSLYAGEVYEMVE